jgi:flavin-dependent dehydrogenase
VWALAAPPAHRRSELLAFKAHFADADLPADLMPLLVFAGGYGGMVHSDAGRVTLSCCIRRDALEQCRRRHRTPHAGEAVLQHIRESCAGVHDALRHARPAGAWLSAGPIRPGIRKGYANGIFRVGNLAGEAHPIVAEGISMAMQSAWLLCRRLLAQQDDVVAGRALVETGRAYGADWRRCFATRVRVAAVLAHLAMRPNAGRPLLPLIRRCPEILTLGARLSGKARRVVPAT